MMRIVLLACVVAVSACATVRINHDNTTSIRHKGDAQTGQTLADEVCHKAGERSAVVLSTVNKDASLPPGSGTQVTTFRCSSDPR